MSDIITVGLDLAKNVFQVHGSYGAVRALGWEGMLLRKALIEEAGGAGEQDGADCLGANGEKRSLQSSVCSGVSRLTAARTSERKRARSCMAQRS